MQVLNASFELLDVCCRLLDDDRFDDVAVLAFSGTFLLSRRAVERQFARTFDLRELVARWRSYAGRRDHTSVAAFGSRLHHGGDREQARRTGRADDSQERAALKFHLAAECGAAPWNRYGVVCGCDVGSEQRTSPELHQPPVSAMHISVEVETLDDDSAGVTEILYEHFVTTRLRCGKLYEP